MALDHSRWEWQEMDVTERQKELRRLVAMWEKTNRNLDKLFKQNPDLQESCVSGKTMLIPSRDGVAQLAWLPDLRGWHSTPQKTEALRLFIGLLVNPLSRFLGGPCARCGRYFAKTDPRQKTHCSRRAATLKTLCIIMHCRNWQVSNECWGHLSVIATLRSSGMPARIAPGGIPRPRPVALK
jgi:hypothetical protein